MAGLRRSGRWRAGSGSSRSSPSGRRRGTGGGSATFRRSARTTRRRRRRDRHPRSRSRWVQVARIGAPYTGARPETPPAPCSAGDPWLGRRRVRRRRRARGSTGTLTASRTQDLRGPPTPWTAPTTNAPARAGPDAPRRPAPGPPTPRPPGRRRTDRSSRPTRPQPGPANARWRALLARAARSSPTARWARCSSRPGLQFGDPPEAWNVSNPEVVRRIHRGYLDAGSRIVMTNTFGGNRLRLRLHGLDKRVARAQPDGGDPPPGRGRRGRRPGARRGRHRADRRDHGAARDARRGRGGRRLRRAGRGADRRRRRRDLDRDDVAPVRDRGGDPRAPARRRPTIPIIATMTFDTRGYTMMGVSPEQAARSLLEAGADAIGGNCGNGPDELLPVIAKMARGRAGCGARRQVERRACPSWSTCGRSTARIRRRWPRPGSGSAPPAPGSSAPAAARRRPTSRRWPRRSECRTRAERRSAGSDVAPASPSASRSPASTRVGSRFSAGVSGHENCGA